MLLHEVTCFFITKTPSTVVIFEEALQSNNDDHPLRQGHLWRTAVLLLLARLHYLYLILPCDFALNFIILAHYDDLSALQHKNVEDF